MSKLKTIALAAGFTALSGNALARETPAESRDSVSTTTETVIQNQPERKTYAISDKTLRFRTIRDEVKNTQYASKSLNNDGTVFIGVQENGQQESRSVILTKEYGAVNNFLPLRPNAGIIFPVANPVVFLQIFNIVGISEL